MMENLFSRRRRRGITALSIALPLAAGVLVAAGGIVLGQYRQANRIPSGKDAALVLAAADPDASQTVFLPPEELGKGSLLVVNEEYPYHGQGQLVDLLEEEEKAYLLRDGTIQASADFVLAFSRMAEDFAQSEGEAQILLLDGYRSREGQLLLSQKSADTREAGDCRLDPSGSSDHHTGLAGDLAWMKGDSILRYDAGPWEWLAEHAPDYGFLLEGEGDVGHIRYVGFPHSWVMAEEGWGLARYLDEIQQYSFEHPCRVTTPDGSSWGIYWVLAQEGGTKVPVPRNAGWQISGDNRTGYVVTVRESAGESRS